MEVETRHRNFAESLRPAVSPGTRLESVAMRTHSHLIKTSRRLLIVAAIAGSGATSVAPASADVCSTNANGIANSNGAAAGAATSACAPAWGRQAGDHTGRKVG
jgi:hypothetical protein